MMLRKLLSYLPSTLVLALLGLLSFGAVAHAASAATGDDVSILDLARPVYDAFVAHQFGLMGALLVILLVAAAKKYLGDAIPFLHTDAGGSLLVLLGSGATALAAALATPGAAITLALMYTALKVAFVAAGGYAAVKNLLVDPFLKPLAARAPAWMKPIFDLILWIFSHGTETVPAAVVVAEKAGTDAVATTAGTGVGGVVGRPGDLP